MCVNHEDDDGIQRTIHKAKGDEFDNVMVCLGDERHLISSCNPICRIMNRIEFTM